MSVENSLSSVQRITHPPQLDFGSNNFAAVESIWSVWMGPSATVVRLAISSAAQQEILQLQGPARNSSYELEFLGPAIQCNILDQSQLAGFNKSLNAYYTNFNMGNQVFGEGLLAYASWAPSSQFPDLSTPVLN